MNKLRCIIVDDEPVARKVLREFIEQVPYLALSGQFENTAKADLFLKGNAADLILLDIEMPKVSGLTWLKTLADKPMVILSTAFPKYALEGYELDIIDYLLKPIAFSRFTKAVQKAREYAEIKEGRLNPSILFVRSDKRIERIDVRDILYIESLGNYVSICAGQKNLIAYLTLKGLESQLPMNEFIKVHQSYIINFNRVDAIEGNQLLVGNKSFPIGRNYRDKVMRLVEQRLLKR